MRGRRDRDTEQPGTELTFTVKVIELGKGCVAYCELGGVSLRSPYCEDSDQAVRQLLAQVVNGNGDAPLALGLALQGTNLADAIGPTGAELPAGDPG